MSRHEQGSLVSPQWSGRRPWRWELKDKEAVSRQRAAFGMVERAGLEQLGCQKERSAPLPLREGPVPGTHKVKTHRGQMNLQTLCMGSVPISGLDLARGQPGKQQREVHSGR